jgi:endoglucanase
LSSCGFVAFLHKCVGPDESDTIDASEFFPLDELNAHIWDPDNKATYDAETHSLTTAQYGFGGWQNDTPVDLSDYQTLIVTLKEAQTTGANFRMFDENSYWAHCTQTDFGDATSVSIDLTTVKKVVGDSTLDFDPSHVYIAGFWSYGGNPIKIKSITLVKEVAGISEVLYSEEPNVNTAVFNLAGQMVGKVSDLQSLPCGIYIVNGRKILK